MGEPPATAEPPPEPAPKRRWRRWLLWAVLALNLFAVLLFVLIIKGYPQARLIEYAIHRATGLKAHAEGVFHYPALTIDKLLVVDPARNDRVVLEIEGLFMTYSLMPEDGRRIQGLTAQRVAVRADAELLSRIETVMGASEPSKEPSLTYVPKDIVFLNVDAQLTLPSVIADVQGIVLAGKVESLQRFSVEVGGIPLAGSVELPLSGFATSLDGGSLEISGFRERTSVQLTSCRVSLPNLAEIDASGHAELAGMNITFAVDIPDFRILGEGEKTVLLPGTEVPVTVGSLGVRDAHVAGSFLLPLQRFALSEMRLSGQATGMRIGEGEAAWNLGGLAWNAQGEYPDFDATLTINEKLPVELRASFGEDAITAGLSSGNWTRAGLAELLPAEYDAYLDKAPRLEGFSAEANAGIRYPEYSATLMLTPQIEDGGPFTGPIQGRATGRLSRPVTASGEVTLPIADGDITASFSLAPPEPPRGEITLSSADPGPILSITTLGALPEALARRFSGTVAATWNTDALAVRTNLQGAEGSWGTDLVNPMAPSLDASINWEPATGILHGDNLMLKAEDHFRVQAKSWTLQPEPLAFKGTLEGKADLAGVFPAAAEMGLGAEIRFKVPVSLKQEVLSFSLDAVSDYLQYGDLTFYEAPFHAAGQVSFPLKKGEGTVRDFALTYGETSSLKVSEATFSPSPFRVTAPFELNSKLQLLVDAGLLESIEGSASARGEVVWAENLVITSDYSLEAPLLVTGGSSVALGGIAARGNLRVDESLNGEATVHAVKCALAGIPLKNVNAPLHIEGAVIRLAPLQAELFNGTAKGEISIDTSGESPVIQVGAQLRNVDLALFAEKMIPPDYALQGLAQGRITTELTPDGLEHASVRLVSSGDFAMNKALLQNVLLKQLQGIKGERAIERISADVLEKGDWQPFDSVALDLYWQDEMLTGTARFRSASLNLTVDLNIEEGAIRQILALQQEARLEDIENIRSEPVQQKGDDSQQIE